MTDYEMEKNETLKFFSQLSAEIKFYFLTVVTPIGIITNIFSVIIFMRKNLNKTNMGLNSFFKIS